MIVKIWLKNGWPDDTVHCLPDALGAYERLKSNSSGTLNTTCTELCDMRVIEEDQNGLVLAFREQDVELKLGENCISGRLIRPGLNLHKLLLAGEFSPASKPVCRILQLRDDEENRRKWFVGLEERHALKIPYPNIAEYEIVYDYPLEPGKELDVEEIYRIFNVEHPEDFHGHSLSVGDVLCVEKDGEAIAYFCNSWDFVKLDASFFQTN